MMLMNNNHMKWRRMYQKVAIFRNKEANKWGMDDSKNMTWISEVEVEQCEDMYVATPTLGTCLL